MTTGCVRLSTCVPVPLLLLPVCLTALSVLLSVCLLYDVLWGPPGRCRPGVSYGSVAVCPDAHGVVR